MPPVVSSKIFNIPFLGGAATVVCAVKYKYGPSTNQETYSLIVQYNADGTTVNFGGGDLSLLVSVNDGFMTVTLEVMPGYTIIDCRCCLIPGVPFAQ